MKITSIELLNLKKEVSQEFTPDEIIPSAGQGIIAIQCRKEDSKIQKLLNKHYGNRIVVTTDSSSPGQYPVYGTYLHSHNFKKLSFTDVYMPKPDKDEDGNMIPLAESKIPDLQPDLLVPDSLGDPASADFTWGMLGSNKRLLTKAGSMDLTLRNGL